MSIGFQCPGCQRPYNVDSALAGKRVRCKQCGHEMRVPTPSRPASASTSPAPKSKPKPPPVPADIYGFDDESTEPAAATAPDAPMPRAETRRPSQASGGLNLTDLFGWSPKKKRRSGDEGPWGVPLRYVVIVLFFLSVGGARMARRQVVQPQVIALFNYVRLGGTLLMAVTVVGALASFLFGNRGAFRGHSQKNQIAWGLAIVWFSSLQVVIWMRPRPAPEPKPAAAAVAAPIPPARAVQADPVEPPAATPEQATPAPAPMPIPAPLPEAGPIPPPPIPSPPVLQPPDFPFPGGPPRGIGRPPGFPPPPPRPNFPGPPGFAPPGR